MRSYTKLGLGTAGVLALLSLYAVRQPQTSPNENVIQAVGPQSIPVAPQSYSHRPARVTLSAIEAIVIEHPQPVSETASEHTSNSITTAHAQEYKKVLPNQNDVELEGLISADDMKAWKLLREKDPYLKIGSRGVSYDNIINLLEVLDRKKAKDTLVRDIKDYVRGREMYELAVRAYEKERELDLSNVADLREFITENIKESIEHQDPVHAVRWWDDLGFGYNANASALTHDLPLVMIRALGERKKEYIRWAQQGPLPFSYESYIYAKNLYEEKLHAARARGDQKTIETSIHHLDFNEKLRCDFEDGTMRRQHYERREEQLEEVDNILNTLLQ